MVESGNAIRDREVCNFAVLEWMGRHSAQVKSIAGLARELGFSNEQQVRTWIKDGWVPLMLYKAILQKWSPDEADAYQKKLVVRELQIGYKLTPAVGKLANAYDARNAGKRIAKEDGGYLVIKAPPGAAKAAERGAALPKAEPEPYKPEPQPVRAVAEVAPVPEPVSLAKLDGAVHEVLLTVMLSIQQERNEAVLETERLKGEIRSLRSTVAVQNDQLKKLREDVETYQRLAEEALSNRPVPRPGVDVNDIVRATLAEILNSKAPSLKPDLERVVGALPKRTAAVS